MNDLIASHVDMLFVEAAVARQQHNNGKARILAVATDKRVDDLPEIPTFAESGISGLESATWNAIAAPPGTPKAITETLNRAINEIMALPDVRAATRGDQHAAGRRLARRHGAIHSRGNQALGRRDQVMRT